MEAWRKAHPQVLRPPATPEDDGAKSAVDATSTPGAATFSVTFSVKISNPFAVSLTRIAALKKELREAWERLAAQPWDVKAALRFVRAAFYGGRPEAADDLLRNSKLVDVAPILADMYSPDEAARLALIWAQRLRDQSHLDLAMQLLEDFSTITDIQPLLKAQVRDNLRSLHYGIAQGHFSDGQKPSPSTRIRHMQAIIELGFELGYVYKFLAEAFHELGDDETARSHLRHAIEIDPQVSGVKTIMRVLGMLDAEPEKTARRSGSQRRYTRPEDVPSVSNIVDWFQNEQWEPILAYCNAEDYSPRLLPHARDALVVIAEVLGECPNSRALGAVCALFKSVYWDVRRAALLSLAKLGGTSELEMLHEVKRERGDNDRFVLEPVSYAEARLGDNDPPASGSMVKEHAEDLLRTYSYKQYGEIGRMRWRLESCLHHAEDANATDLLVLLTKYCLEMDDWSRVLRLLRNSSLPAVNEPAVVQLQINLAAALVRGRMKTAALSCLRPIYDKLSPATQFSADAVLWDALHSFEFIGVTNYLWALRILLERAVGATSPDELLQDLHRLARVMEPIGQQEIGIWLRHTLRAEAPGHYFGDAHDRLNYFRSPELPLDFERDLKLLFEVYRPRILERLVALLPSARVIARPGVIDGSAHSGPRGLVI